MIIIIIVIIIIIILSPSLLHIFSYVHCFFQDPFKQMTYSMIGDGDAPKFFKIDKNSGEIKVNADLRSVDTMNFTVSIDLHLSKYSFRQTMFFYVHVYLYITEDLRC